MEYEAMEMIEMMYSNIAEAKAMPLAAGRCIVERDELLSMLEELRDNLPREMEEARRLWEAKDEFIASAKREAEQIRAAAEEQARQLVEKETIVVMAKARAEEIERSAKEKQDALFYATTQMMGQTVAASENALAKALDEVRILRHQLTGVAAPAQPAEPKAAPKTNLAPKGYEVMGDDAFEFEEDEE